MNLSETIDNFLKETKGTYNPHNIDIEFFDSEKILLDAFCIWLHALSNVSGRTWNELSEADRNYRRNAILNQILKEKDKIISEIHEYENEVPVE